MATITEDYVSFAVSKLLKEKGFDEACDKKYFGDDCSGPSYIRERWEDGGDVCPMSNSDLDDGSKYADISAPTLQMAMKWLRLIYHIHIRLVNSTDESYRYEIYPRKSKYNSCCFSDKSYYETYEQACEAAIKYCLENLI